MLTVGFFYSPYLCGMEKSNQSCLVLTLEFVQVLIVLSTEEIRFCEASVWACSFSAPSSSASLFILLSISSFGLDLFFYSLPFFFKGSSIFF